MPEELSEAIAENAAGPKRVESDGVVVEQHPLSEQIAADKYLEQKEAGRRTGAGIRVLRIVGPENG